MKKIVCSLLFALTALHTQAQTAPLRVLPTYGEPEYNAGSVPGNNQQYMTGFAYSESDPSRLYMSQDVGGVWVSRDAGKNWNTLKNRGLLTRFNTAIEVDPLDKNRLFVVGSCEDWDALHRSYQGIYMSTDGGINWNKVAARSEVGFIRRTTHLLSYAPSSKNTGLGYATRWYAAISEFNGSASIVSDDGFMYSDDGGATWTETRKLDAATFGVNVFGIRTHPTDMDIVYMYGSEGLIRFDDATDPTGTYTKLSGTNGLPGGTIGSDIYISPDANTFIVGVAGSGVYKSTDGGNNWSQIYAYAGLVKCFVNPAFPDAMFVTASSSGGQVQVTKDGGVTWNTTVSVTPVPGFSGNWNTRIYGSFAGIVPDPRNPDRAFAQGNAMFFQTDNGGSNWYPSNGYFNGNQIAGNFEQMFDPVNPDRFAYFMVDVGVRATTNRGKWFTKDANISSFVTAKTCRAGSLHPDGSTGIMLACVQASTGQLLRSVDNGVTWASVRPVNRKRWFIAFDQQDPNYCYQWQERSADAGVTWTQLTVPGAADPIICGISYQDGKVIYAIDVAGTATKVYRSTDRGDNWVLAFTSPTKLTSPLDQQFMFKVHPADHNIVFTSSPTGELTKWDLTNLASPVTTNLQPMGAPVETGFYISRLAIDRRFPDVMYTINMRQGTANKFFRSQDGGLTWENLTDMHPATNIGGLEVSPVTGELFLSSASGGVLVMPPPYATTETEKSKMAYYTTAWSNSYLSEPYAASVGSPSPYGGIAVSLPGTLQAEFYDEGGNDAGYHDDNLKMGDLAYRSGDFVDTESDASATGGYRVAQTARGEWLAYTVDITASTYNIGLRYSSVSPVPGRVRIFLNGTELGILTGLASTGSLSTFNTVTLESVALPGGDGQVLRIEVMEGGQVNLDALTFVAPSLPVTLTQFSAHKLLENNQRAAVLTWTTTSELSSSHFDIERSYEGTDWKNLGSVDAARDSERGIDYSFNDPDPDAGTNYYRLKMVDMDGTYAYSRIQAVDFQAGQRQMVLFPVPSGNMLNINGLEANAIRLVTVTNLSGRVVYESEKVHSTDINLKSLTSGMYLIRVTDKNGVVYTDRFIVQK